MTPQNGEPPADEKGTGTGNTDSASVVARELHWLEKLNIAGQMSLVIVGIIAACIYGCQLNVMRGTLTEMKRSGEQSTEQMWSAIGNINWEARSMDLSQQQAQKSLEATIDNFHREQRPWVVVKSIDLGILAENNGTVLTTMTRIMNSGKSPGFDIKIMHSGFQTNYGPLDLDRWIATGKEKKPSHIATSSILAPGDDSPVPGERVSITETQAGEIRKHVLWVYAFGDIHYRDSFGVAHFTQYCGIYDPPTNRFDNCKTHTYIDRNK